MCEVRICLAIPGRLRAATREIRSVQTEPGAQGQGHASALLHEVCREADAANITLLLWPQPYGEHIALSRMQLADWYARRFGFQTIQPEPILMARMPGTTPRYATPLAFAASEACHA
jgi:GNAT superfamily N-acetyltransferase